MSEYNFVISKEKIDDNSFIVCLLSVPDFPVQPDHLMEVVRKPLQAVIGAIYGSNGWSFTTLDRNERHIIGDELNSRNALPGEWFWCTQSLADNTPQED